MRSSATLLALVSAAAAQNQTAPLVTNNLPGAFLANLRSSTGNLTAVVTASSLIAGTAVNFTVTVSGLPAVGAPFTYHIHEKPVPADGNCTGTGAHLDPYKRGQDPPCNSTAPQTCQVGDLSGKHGAFTAGGSGVKAFGDPYVSTNPADVQYFGNLSVVIHNVNSTRLACANFTKAPGRRAAVRRSSPRPVRVA